MFATSCAGALALSILLLPSAARVMWMAEEFDPSASHSLVARADVAKCGGDTSLTYCGGGMPSDFCCPAGTRCLALDTKGSVTAAICCGIGQDCARIAPVSCDISLQNTTVTQLHVKPPQQLDSCGDQCCPMGYDCNNGQCIARTAPTPVSQTSPKSTSGTSTSTTSSGAATTSGGAGVKPGFVGGGTDSDFNGKSFAAGFVPGIAIGAFIAALIILLCIRKRRDSERTHTNEKPYNRDTLTDLGTLHWQPTSHGRNISDPKPDPSAGYRTDFSRRSPPRPHASGYSATVNSPAGPVTPSDSPPKIKALFSRSPFMGASPASPPTVQQPAPAHRFSFKISPVRALKKQKSTHSLRRQMTEDKRNTRWPTQSRISRSGSTETIQVLMPSNEPYTPDRSAKIPESTETLSSATFKPNKSTASTWSSTNTTADATTPDERQQAASQLYASSSRYPSDVHPLKPWAAPPVPRLPGSMQGTTNTSEPYGFLGSPYTPTREPGGARSKGSLAPPGMDNRRDTTFSAMMERAGLRKSDLLVGARGKK